jgi:hypothetical protein
VSVILPQAVYRRLLEAATELRVTVEVLLREAAERLVVPTPLLSAAASATGA